MTEARLDGGAPLAGFRVLDLTIALAGPMCTQRLGEMGADVIKVEAPGGGDFSRHNHMAGVVKFGDSICYMTANRNKRSVALNLKSEAGRAALYKLAERADALVQSFRPRVATQLGIDYATLSKVNPRLVCCAINGYGDEGPMRDRPGQDLLLQSFTGLMLNGGAETDLPQASPVYLVDVLTSHLACQGVLAGLIARGRTGRGQEVKVSMLSAIMEAQAQELTAFLSTGAPPRRSRTPAASIYMEPPYGVYRCREGVLSLAQGDLAELAELLGEPALAELKRQRPPQSDVDALARWRDEIYERIARRLATGDARDWDEKLSAHGVWCGVVNDYGTFLAHPQTQGALAEIEHPRAGRFKTVAPAIRFSDDRKPRLAAAPSYGADTLDVLREIGLSDAEIAAAAPGFGPAAA
jgi:crotonobetainyl-CoA:carnitine CoA-transferase CaiB-like acyl-CoA transferase